MSQNQLARDLMALCMLAGAVAIYHLTLRYYLADLDKPMFFELGFLMSFGVACLYEMKGGFRVIVAGCAVTGLVFVAGALAAIWFRSEYMQLVAQFRDVSEMGEVFGQDLAAALSNRAVGYGGAFAVGLMAARLTLGSSTVRGLIVKRLLGPAGELFVCSCCGQTVVRSA